ncbi:MAG TPA: Abi-alpha family protein [Xanthobacteraceae bacterium]|nr:Abi-alpha family protein [Xanthobacteraceae bacterium]
MGIELIKPIDSDTAHAIEEAAKTAGKAIDAASETGKYFSRVLGQVPENLVGILDDWLYHKRARLWAEHNARTFEHLRRWGAKEPFEDPAPALAVPLIAAAIDEDREELKDLWARLLASAMHPDRKKRVRLSFIGILKQLDPLDALCLRALDEKKDSVAREEWHPMLMTRFAASADEIQVSIDKLRELHLVEIVGQPKVIALGKLFLAGVED